MRVTVEQRHIDAALEAYEKVYEIETCCPIAQALTEKRPDLEWHVVYDGWPGGVYENGEQPLEGSVSGLLAGVEVEHYELSKRACYEAYMFDHYDDFKAGRFDLRKR